MIKLYDVNIFIILFIKLINVNTGKLYAVKRIEIASGCSPDEMAEMVQVINLFTLLNFQ